MYSAVKQNRFFSHSLSLAGRFGVALVFGLTVVGCSSLTEPPVSGDVYVAGNDGKAATVWKNGEPTYLTDGVQEACAYSIFVVE